MTVEHLIERCDSTLSKDFADFQRLDTNDRFKCSEALLCDLISTQQIPVATGFWALSRLPECDLQALNDLLVVDIPSAMKEFYAAKIRKLLPA